MDSKVRESSLKSVMVCSVQFKCCLPLQKWKDSAVPKPSVQNHAPPSLIPEHRKLIADDLRLFALVVLGSTHTAYIQIQTYLFIHFFQAPPALIIFLILLFILIQPREADFRLFQSNLYMFSNRFSSIIENYSLKRLKYSVKIFFLFLNNSKRCCMCIKLRSKKSQ